MFNDNTQRFVIEVTALNSLDVAIFARFYRTDDNTVK